MLSLILNRVAHGFVQASVLEQLRLQGQASGAIGSLTLAPSMLTPTPSGGGHPTHLDTYSLQGLGQGLAGQSALQPNAAALSTLARLACSGGLAGLTAAAAAAGAGAPQQTSFAGQAPHHGGRREAGLGHEHTATNVPDGRPSVVQACFDGVSRFRLLALTCVRHAM